jgi:catechol 2,3-dioxygenase-like lactoylglutathione lyase family enzyme
MTARINHVSVPAADVQASADFYVELVGAEPIAAPNFGFPVRWLALGRTQLHLFAGGGEPIHQQHFAIAVDDLEPALQAAERRGALDRTTFGNHLVELPGGIVQLYVRDPAGNLVEINAAGVDRLPEDVREQLQPLRDVHPQDDVNLSARLFVPE